MSLLPEGEELRKAVKWIDQRIQTDSEVKLNRLMETACIKFNLSPIDSDFLTRFFATPSKFSAEKNNSSTNERVICLK